MQLFYIFIQRPQKLGSSHKITQFKCFQAEYTKKLGHSLCFFRKIGKFIQIAIQLTKILTIYGGELQKFRIFRKTVKRIFDNEYLQIICGSTRVQK